MPAARLFLVEKVQLPRVFDKNIYSDATRCAAPHVACGFAGEEWLALIHEQHYGSLKALKEKLEVCRKHRSLRAANNHRWDLVCPALRRSRKRTE